MCAWIPRRLVTYNLPLSHTRANTRWERTHRGRAGEWHGNWVTPVYDTVGGPTASEVFGVTGRLEVERMAVETIGREPRWGEPVTDNIGDVLQ